MMGMTSAAAAGPKARTGRPTRSRRSVATAAVAAAEKTEEETTVSFTAPVVVTGANGRTGALIVRELLSRGATVRAVVRDAKKASKELGEDVLSKDVELMEIKDLSNEVSIKEACKGAGTVIWAAQGDGRAATPVENVTGLLGTLLRASGIKKQSSSASAAKAAKKGGGGLDHVAAAMKEEGGRVVLLSSAAVTRNSWSAEKQTKYRDCVEIPIVRLNPVGILDATREAEQRLRKSGADYAIVRPCGLRDTTGAKSWPRGRPWLSQGDVAIGRANREDVADVLVQVATAPEALGKTFEMLTLAGGSSYPAPADGLGRVLDRLSSDADREAWGRIWDLEAVKWMDLGKCWCKPTFRLLCRCFPVRYRTPLASRWDARMSSSTKVK